MGLSVVVVVGWGLSSSILGERGWVTIGDLNMITDVEKQRDQEKHRVIQNQM